MIELLPKMFLHGNKPCFYDGDSVTVIELSATLHGKVNELINEYNKFADEINTQVNEFITLTNADYEIFRTSIRQEFQDFIDVINLKVMEQDNIIAAALEELKEEVMNAISGGLSIKMTYDEATEALNIGFYKEEEE